MASNYQSRDVGKYLTQQQANAPTKEIATEWSEMEELYNKKLWHQLTVKLLSFVKNPIFAEGNALVDMYNNFLADFESRINPLSLIETMVFVLKQIKDPQESVDFLSKLEPKVKNSSEATILCKILKGQVYLQVMKDMLLTKKHMDDIDILLNEMDGISTVHGRYYELASDYHRIQGNHADYYRTALRYLGCTDLESMELQEKRDRAFYLGLAALLGEGVYNFGELLAHPILESLKEDPRSWLVDLLFIFNSGDIARFEKLRKCWEVQADLAAKQRQLAEKISLLCLMEMTFKRPANGRQLLFEEIASETKLPVDEVELLVMKALSLQLVKGSIDQVSGKVHITWVQPRVLDKQQISVMMQRLDLWCKEIHSMEMLVENKANDILTY